MTLTGKEIKKGLRIRFKSDKSVSGSGAQCTVEAISLETLWQLGEALVALAEELLDEDKPASGSKPYPTILGPKKGDQVKIK